MKGQNSTTLSRAPYQLTAAPTQSPQTSETSARTAYELGCIAFVESLFEMTDPQHTIDLVTDAFFVCAVRQDADIVNIDSGHLFIGQLRQLPPLFKYYESC